MTKDWAQRFLQKFTATGGKSPALAIGHTNKVVVVVNTLPKEILESMRELLQQAGIDYTVRETQPKALTGGEK